MRTPKPIDSPYLIQPGKAAHLKRLPTDASQGGIDKPDAKGRTRDHLDRIEALQEVLYAEHERAVLIVLQALDAGGKDSTIRKVFGQFNPQGVRVTSFKVPSSLEQSHDYLWRYHLACPTRGHIGIFNRSHYESVLVERVKGLVPEATWRRRYEQINQWEAMLASEGTTILKFFLHLSPSEQAERFRERLTRPDKWWKFNEGDLAERARWPAYMEAFEDALARTSTAHAPWYAIPADQKWYRDMEISRIFREALEAMDPQYPAPPEGMAAKIEGFLGVLEGEEKGEK